MIKSIHPRNTVIAVLLVLFTAAGLLAETTNELSDSDLLRIVRQKDGADITVVHTERQAGSMGNESLQAVPVDILSGRDLLRIMRQKDSGGTKPSYAQREAEARKPVTTDVDVEPTTKPTDKESPTEPEEPVTPTIEPEQMAKPTDDEMLMMVPADSLFCLRVNNFDYTLNMIDQFLTGVSPVPMGLSMLTRMQFANLLGSPQLNGVNMGGSFIAFGTISSDESTAPNPANIFIGILVPVTNYKQFIDGNPNCDQPDEKGISKITSEQALTMLATRTNNNYALLTPIVTPENHERLASTAKSISDTKSIGLAGVLDAAEAQLARNEPVWIYGNIQLVSRIFGPAMSAQLEQMKTMGPAEAQIMTGLQPNDLQNIMNMYTGILETLMKETKSVSLTINPKPNVLNITETISAVPDTNMANMFVSDASAQQENKLLRYLEDGAAMNFGFKMNTPFVEKLSDTGIEFYEAFFGGAIKAEDIAKMKTLSEDWFSAAGEVMAASVSIDAKNKPPFASKSFIEIKDADKYYRLLEESTEFWNIGGFADLYKSMGMEMSYTFKRNADSYKGVSIDSARLVTKSIDPNSPQQMINAMYGDGFDYRWAIVDQLCLCATCGDVDSTIREMIDTAQAGAPKEMSSEMKVVTTLLPEADKADFVCTFNLLRFFKMITAMVPMPMPQMDAPTKSNIALAGKVGNGRMTINIAVPKEHLTEIMSAVMMMQQQMMQQQTPMQTEPTPQQNLWTCPMHPQVQQAQKGLCPICGAELVPVQKK